MFILISTTFASIFSLIITFIIYKKYNILKDSKKFFNYFIFFWFFVFLAQFILLGPSSPIHFYDNADIGLSRILYEKNHHLGGRYLHSVLGGQDFYSVQAFGGQFFSLEKVIFSAFPIWIAILIHKFLLLFFGFFGTYQLFRKVFNFEKLDSLFAGSFYSIFNPYTVFSTIHHGLGFSLIPLSIFIFLYQTENKFYFLKIFSISVLISISTLPLHSFLAVIGALVVTVFVKKPDNFIKFSLSIIILLFTIFLNWHESLYSMYEMRDLSNRSFSSFNFFMFLGSIGWLQNKTELCLVSCKIQFSPIVIIFFILLIVLLFSKRYKTILILLIINYVPNIGLFLINIFDISPLKSLNLYNYSYYLAIPILIYFLNSKNMFKKTIFKNILPSIILFFSLIYLINNKFIYFKKIFFENQKQVNSIQNLIDRNWEPKKFYRMVSTNPWDLFHPNFLWAYGIDTADGYVNLVNINFSKFWSHGIRKKKLENDQLYYGGNFYINDIPQVKNYDLKSDLNLLKFINVGYIASYTPINSKEIELVSGEDNDEILSINEPTLQRDLKFLAQKVKKQFKYTKKPKDILIYKVSEYSDRFYFPKKLIIFDKNLNKLEIYRFISEKYEKNIAFSNQSVGLASGEILKANKIKNGYSLDIKVNKNGLFIFNSFYEKYWRAYSNKKKIDLINLTNAQIGLFLTEDMDKIKIIYDRPTFLKKYFK
tara:strand:- start:5948 stop:8071 length:2124 start_codon:yes stop_codon:yes gene_type:complete